MKEEYWTIKINEEKAAAKGDIGDAKIYFNDLNGQCTITLSKELRDKISERMNSGDELKGIIVDDINGLLFVPRNMISSSFIIKTEKASQSAEAKD